MGAALWLKVEELRLSVHEHAEVTALCHMLFFIIVIICPENDIKEKLWACMDRAAEIFDLQPVSLCQTSCRLIIC